MSNASVRIFIKLKRKEENLIKELIFCAVEWKRKCLECLKASSLFSYRKMETSPNVCSVLCFLLKDDWCRALSTSTWIDLTSIYLCTQSIPIGLWRSQDVMKPEILLILIYPMANFLLVSCFWCFPSRNIKIWSTRQQKNPLMDSTILRKATHYVHLIFQM